MTLPEYRTVEEVAAHLGIAYRTVLKAIAAGELRARRVGKRYLITEGAVTDYIDGTAGAAPISGRTPRTRRLAKSA